MTRRDFGARMGEISSLIYLIFPFYGVYLTRNREEFILNIIVVFIFTIAYSGLILFHQKLNHRLNLTLFIVHLIAIIYFVALFSPMLSLFFFFSAFAIPFMFKASVKSIEFLLLLLTMVSCLIVTVYQDDIFSLVSLLIYYIVILALLFGNFSTAKDRETRRQLEAKNKYINVLIAEQERNRIGQDLHDTLGHVFASLSLKSELAFKLIETNPESAKEEIKNINEISKETLNKVRHIIENLKVQNFEDEIISIDNILHDANIEFSFENKQGANSLNPAKQSILAMIFREMINNIIKHAQATKVESKLENNQESIQLLVKDNGIGIKNPKEIKLKSISDRVELLHGALEVESINGTQLKITIPREGVQ
ncbi:sensor histidine kinase [Staphylococcus sp. NRL 16/872]|uniref:sensor histidine kinase n=1 Tax=Staphylococcus sp. NRL 16/872 TaxID=2930131 RepID=UPI001FB3F132|nr:MULTISPECIES: sensor histidine kinase [unclassified Staphylococcus]MCJ1656450.1 sensor histidine kinase [Staphylococcus sp. NRL 21/187]MCJ1662215.1 sensor histidine kinase [Staphylococcus sp. NRL 18/288]WEN68487.1 sensor histidine kinase [Staphylococcus sp. NRL 16/872]